LAWEPIEEQPHSVLHSNGRLLALPTNIRLGCEWLPVTNTSASYGTKLITTVKKFYKKASEMIHLAGASLINLFTAVMYKWS
jgi:hypothetical protein